MEINLHLGGIELAFIILTVVLIGLTCFFYFRSQRVSSQLGAPSPGIPWRKLAPYLLFLGLGVLFVVLRPVVHNLLVAAYSAGEPTIEDVGLGTRSLAALGDSAAIASVKAVKMNADGAEIAADQVAGGYVQLGNATSKIVMMLAIYALFSFVPWVFQQLTHPGPTAWKKDNYTGDFNALPAQTKFEVDGRLGLNAAIRVLAAVVGACLIQ